ncbi:hypothetical protein [Dongia mobilis]|nr:hypothetical protein [Dongia mobilis]
MTPKETIAEDRLRRLVERLPAGMARFVHRLRRPAARWLRIPAALFFVAGGILFFLPVVGLWMLPLGLLLLVEDVPVLRRRVYGAVNWLAERRPDWFA